MAWFRTRCTWWEVVFLLVATFALFRPDYFMDKMYAPYAEVPAKEIFRVASELPEDDRLVLVIEGTNIEGEDIKKTVAVQLGKPDEGRKRLAEAGLTISALGPEVRVSAVKFGSRAKKSGFEQGFKVAAVKVPSERPSEHWVYIPALALVAVARKVIRQWYGRALFRKTPSFLWCHTHTSFLSSLILPSASASSFTISNA